MMSEVTVQARQDVSRARASVSHLLPLLGTVRSRSSAEQATIARLRADISKIETDKAQLLKAVALIDGAIQVVSANGIGVIEQLVTTGLRLVFDDPSMSFIVVKKEGARGNSYELEVQIGELRGPILETYGGGVANVVAFLLRVILINRFQLAKFLIVDESFNNVSVEFLPMVSELLKQLTQARDYTIFAVTHQPTLAAAADNVYRVVPHLGAPPTLHKLSETEVARLSVTTEE